MKKLLLSILVLIPSFCIANNEQQIDKIALQLIKNEVTNVLQEIEKIWNDITNEYGDLSIVPLKMANECLFSDVFQQLIYEININVTSLILEKQSLNVIGDYFDDLLINMNQNDKENMRKIWQNVGEKYKDEADQIYRQMLKKCRDTECDSIQCNNLHTSLWDLPMIFLRINFTKIICDNILEKIDLYKSN